MYDLLISSNAQAHNRMLTFTALNVSEHLSIYNFPTFMFYLTI